MLRWIDRFLNSSIGRKALMAVTGLLLVGFVISHLSGNLLLFQGPEAFDGYVEFLTGIAVLPLLEIGLAGLFVLHILLAIKLTGENRAARPVDYEVKADHGRKTIPSATMIVSGVVILIFLIKHIWDFRWRKSEFSEAPYEMVARAFQDPLTVVIYVLGATALGLHLFHAISSAFQTLGVNHPKYTPLITGVGRALAIGLALGFAVIPIFFLLNGGAHQ